MRNFEIHIKSSDLSHTTCNTFQVWTGLTANIAEAHACPPPYDAIRRTDILSTTGATVDIQYNNSTLVDEIFVFLVHCDGFILPSSGIPCCGNTQPKNQGGYQVSSVRLFCPTPTPTPTLTSSPTPTLTASAGVVLPTPTLTPTSVCDFVITYNVNTPTPTPTLTSQNVPIGTTSIYLSSGTTVANACTGTTQVYYYETPNPPTIPTFGYNGKQIYTDSNLINPAPGNNNHTVFYYSPDYNTVYYVSDSEGRKYDSNTPCPSPTPLTGTVINAVVSLVDGLTACNGGDYDTDPSTPQIIDPMFFTFTIYGSNIVDASGIINIPEFLLADFSINQEFYVKARVAPNFYWKKFILDGDPQGGASTATSSGQAVQCPTS